MNKELLLKVADAIEANPEHFDMYQWFGGSDCGTTACIVGWAWSLHKQLSLKKCLSSLYDSTGFSVCQTREHILLIPSVKDWFALTRVFCWYRKDLAARYATAKRSKTKAKIAAEYVRWFVENK